MLPRAARMRNSEEFRRATKRGIRVGRATLVVHAVRDPGTVGVHVGFVVPKAVGNAVTRNRVKRRLRHLVADRLLEAPQGSSLVVRALPPAGTAASDLATDLAAGWSRALAKLATGAERLPRSGGSGSSRP